MHEMEEKVRSDGGLVKKKKKNSSGCLIIKKKGHGIDGVGSSGSRKVFESKKERKRSRLVLSESSEESIEPIRRKVDKFPNGSVVYRNDGGEDGKIGGNDEIESESERKRRLDVFEFDEYDGIDGKRKKKDCFQDKFKLTEREREFGTGSSSKHVMIEKRTKSYFDSNKSSSSGGRKEVADYSVKSRFDEDDDDEAHLPISSLRQKFQVPPDEPIRVQGKNGVLKVMVNKNKTTDLPHKLYDRQLKVRDRKGSKSENAIKKKNVSVGPSFYSDSKRPEKEISIVRTEKSENKLQKSLSSRAKSVDSETEDSDTSLPGPKTVHDRSSSKGVKSVAKAPSAEKITPVRTKEVKVKRGSGTEKQLLREKIRHMLVSAGWTIDYRPRRNRDYLDAVYINPTGTAYWSIIKAYDALQKQLDEEEEDDDDDRKPSGDASPFTPLPEELLSKLTRQTQKKLEREMKMKRKDHSRSKKIKFSREESAEGAHSDQDDDKLSFFMKQNGKSSKGRSHETACVSGDDSSSKLCKGSTEKSSTANNSHVTQGNRSRKFGRCTLLIRSSDKGLNSESDGYIPYTGKRTLLSWLIDSGTVNLSEKVQYMNRRQTRVMLEGWVTRDGIHCGCCSKILTVSKFEIHAGSKLRQPFQNIFLESGVSLLQCQMDAWNKQEESERRGFQTVDIDGDDPNDDTCGLCGDGGDLICCDGCPSTFHQSCLDIQMLPAGDWHCPNCTCKFCGIADGISTQGNCTTVGALRTCSLCEKKYHESCSQEMDPLQGLNCASTSFCGHKCQELFDHLQKLLGVKHELEAGFSWSLVHRTDLDIDASHRGFPQRVESNSKLAVALSVMDECFLPIVDRRSGINLIHNVLYNCGSNFNRLNYSGFYTAILEKGDEIICAASIRIHGTQLAEMPFIGTRHIYRRQGMCRRLFCAIESVLCSLKVEKFIIPAIAEHIHTWTVNFGFNPLEESDKQEMRSVNMLVFPGADMIQKLLVESKTNEGNITVNSGTNSILIKEDHLLTHDLTKNIDVNSSAGHDRNCNTDTDMHNANEMDDKVAVLDSDLPAPAIPSNDNSCLNGSLDVPSDPELKVLSEEKKVHSQSVKKSTESSADMKSSPSCDSQNIQLEMENRVLDPYVKSNSSEDGVVDDVHKANVKVAVSEPILDSSGETSTMNTAEVIDEDQNILSDSTVNGTEENVNQSNTEAQDVPVECNIQSSSKGYEDDANHAKAKVSCVGPILDSKGEISAQNSTEEKINESHDSDSVSSPHVTDERVTPVEGNVQFVTSGDMDDTHEVNGKILAVEPGLDCHGDISAQKKDVNVHASVSMPNVSDESTMPFNLNAASEVAPDEEVALIGGNICSSAEDDVGKDAQKANVGNASVEPVLTSSDETSVENETEEIIENVAVLTSDGCDGRNIQFESDQNQNAAIEMKTELHGSDGSTVQFESDQDQNTAIEMKTELHTDSKAPSDAMDCDKNI